MFGSRFYFAQSWYRKIQNLDSINLDKSNTEHGKWMQHLFGLPFLTPEKVNDCFANYFMSDISKSKTFSKLAD